ACSRLAVETGKQETHVPHIVRWVSFNGEPPRNRSTVLGAEIFNVLFVSRYQPFDEQRKTLQGFWHRRGGRAGLNDEQPPANLSDSRIAFVHSGDCGYPPVILHPTAQLRAGETVSAGVEGWAGKEKVRLKLIEQRANLLQSFFFLFVKIVVAAGDRCIFYGVNFDCTFDHRSYAHGVGQEQHFVAGLIFTADTRKKLVQIVEHF